MSFFTILVAEDNPDDYFILEYAFQRAGFDANRKLARNGLEAKAYLAGEGAFSDRTASPMPALIIADLKMPCMNGLELLRWTRRQPIIKRIPFIMLSASGSPADVNAAYEGFANSYHVKPGRVEELINLLKDLRTYWFQDSVRPDVRADHLAEDNDDNS